MYSSLIEDWGYSTDTVRGITLTVAEQARFPIILKEGGVFWSFLSRQKSAQRPKA
jgi:hypothetical protein